MKKTILSSKAAPAAIGPYSQAVRIGDLLFLSGQLGLDPVTGEFAGADAESQAKQALANMAAVLREAGLAAENVVKTTVFLADMNDFQKVNAVYGAFFTGLYPARSTVQVARLPKDGRVEIEAVAAF